MMDEKTIREIWLKSILAEAKNSKSNSQNVSDRY